MPGPTDQLEQCGAQTAPVAPASPENLIEMQILQLHPRPIHTILLEHSTVRGCKIVSHLKTRLWRTMIDDFYS